MGAGEEPCSVDESSDSDNSENADLNPSFDCRVTREGRKWKCPHIFMYMYAIYDFMSGAYVLFS